MKTSKNETVASDVAFPIHNIPEPTERTHRAKGGSNMEIYPWDELDIGEMFFVPISKGRIVDTRAMVANQISANISYRHKKYGKQYRRHYVTLNGEDGVGVWRIS